MRQVFTYTSKDGTETYKVRYKIDGRSGSTTFDTADDAEQFNLLIERWGVKRALEFIKQPTEPKRTASGPTVIECVQDYISLIPNEHTRKRYTRWLTNSIAPALGSVRINRLKKDDVQRWVNTQAGAAATIERNLILLSASLKAACDSGFIHVNPAREIKIPRRPRNPKRAPLTPAFSREEVALIQKAITPRYQVFVEFLAETGCRFGEAAALVPADVNIKAGTVHFHNSYSYQLGAGQHLGPTKTEASNRVIRVKQSLLEKLDLSGLFVFTTQAGERIKGSAFRAYHWHRAVNASGLPTHRHGHPHDLRHAHATWLLDAGISLPAIQNRLGHADVMTTLRMYGHPGTDSEDRILAALD